MLDLFTLTDAFMSRGVSVRVVVALHIQLALPFFALKMHRSKNQSCQRVRVESCVHCFNFLPFIYSGIVNWANVTFSSDALRHIHTLTRGGCSVQPEVFAVNHTSAVTCKTPCSKTTARVVEGGDGIT